MPLRLCSTTPLKYEITAADGTKLYSGSVDMSVLSVGKNHEATTLSLPLSQFAAPAKYTLSANLGDYGRNHWDFWVYPDSVDMV